MEREAEKMIAGRRRLEISQLHGFIISALEIADDLKLHEVGIRLDQARLAVEADPVLER